MTRPWQDCYRLSAEPARDRQASLTIIAKRMVSIHSVDFA